MTRRVRRSVLVAAERDGRWSVRAEHRMVRRHVVVTETWADAMRLAPAMLAVVSLETPSSRDYTSPADHRRNVAMADAVLELMRASVRPRSRRRGKHRGVDFVGGPGPFGAIAGMVLPSLSDAMLPTPWAMPPEAVRAIAMTDARRLGGIQ